MALLAMLAPSTVWAASSYDALIQRARAGDYEPALQALRQSGQGIRAQYDHILIASWAQRSSEVIEVYGKMHAVRDMPADVLLAVARAYRDQQNWDPALTRFNEGVRRFPDHPAFEAGRIMALGDAGRLDEARTLGQQWLRRQPRNVDAHLALAYAYTRVGRSFDALFHADQAYQAAPEHALVDYVGALSRVRLDRRALELAQAHPESFNVAERRRLQADAAAELVRLADKPSRSETERFALADRAIAQYDELIAAWRIEGEAARDELLRIRIDRLQALHARVRMRELVDEYETLRAAGVVIPRYVLSDVASAYLYLRQPEVARDLYAAVASGADAARDDAIAKQTTQSGLYYANAEAEDFDRAAPFVDNGIQESSPWVYVTGSAQRQPNELHSSALQLAAAASLQANDTPTAQTQLESMVRNAPNHSGLRADLAAVYRARERPRASEEELKLAETLTPRSLKVELGQGDTAMDLQEWRQAEELSADTLGRYPENLEAQRLARAWDVHNKAELRISGYRGLANDSPVSGSGDFGIDTAVYTPPMNYNWRAFAAIGYGSGNFEEGKAHYRWQRAGVQWRGRDLTAQAEVSNNSYGYGNKPGAMLSVAYDVDDHWQVSADAQLRSRETPLRALNSGIYANRLDATVRWRANERRAWEFSISPSRFSDGNQRWDLGVYGRERLYTQPHFILDAELDVSSQHNNGGDDVPYFNPRSDLTVLPGLRATHTLYRRYETAWEQIGTLAAGTYSQQGYGTSGMLALGYGQRYRANDVLDMGAMVTGVNRTYDGQRERELRISFDLTYRF